MQKLYAVYDDKTETFLWAVDKGRMAVIRNPRYGWDSQKIGKWSLSKAQDVIRKRKTFNWNYTRYFITENGNPVRLALRIIRVYSKEWLELTGVIRPVTATIGATRLAGYWTDDTDNRP